MSVFGSKNMGLSDSLINAVKEVGQSGKTIQTNMQRRNQNLDEKKKMDPVDKDELKGTHADRDDKDIDNDGDSDDTDKYLHKRRKAISKSIKSGKKEKDMGQDSVDVNPTMDDVKEESKYGIGYNKKSINHADKGIASLKKSNLKVNHIGHSDSDSGNTQGSKPHSKPDVTIHYERGDKPHRDSPSGATYHTNAAKKHDSHKHLQNADKHGIFEAAGSRSIDKTDGETKLIKPSDSHLCATKVEHAEWGVGECIFSEHAEPDDNGHVAWYDVLFDHGIEHKVPVSEMKVKAEMSHGNHKKKK